MSNQLSIATINISGMREDVKRKAVITYLREHNFDIIFLQETHCHLNSERKKWSLEWDGKSLWSLGTNKSRGVAVLFNRKIDFDVRNEIIDYNGRYIVFDLHFESKKYKMINIYAPNNEYERVRFVNNMTKWLDPELETIIAGDFNCTLNSEMDRLNCVGSRDVGQIDIKNIIKEYDLEDIWRRRNPDKKAYSWRRGKKASRIDYFLISNSLDNQIDNVKYKICPFSDHSMVNMKMRISETEHGKGIWKMNAKILESELFRKSFINLWSVWKQQKCEYNNLRTWWDLGKKKIKDLCIWCSCKVSEDRKERCTVLENKLAHLEKDNGKVMERKIVKEELSKIYDVRGEGAKVRSRIKWFEEGEKSSNYFHSLEKKTSKDKLWECILDDTGNVLYGTDQIINRQVEFYRKLYTTEGINKIKAESFIKCVNKQLSDESVALLDMEITKDELVSSLKKMKNNKSPGPDGIIVEFYKLFWENIGDDIYEIIIDSYLNEQLPHTQYIALIKLLYKKGTRADIRNWRPISLLNADGKLLSKVLAERLKKVLNEIIHTDQQGCIPGRYVGKNIRLVQDIIENHDDDEVVLLLDQQKAFDRVEWEWLFKVLDKFGFGKNFKKWIEIIYKNMKSAMLTNGYVSSYFPISRGIRQGDSLSALLYIIQSEPLAENIRKHEKVKGIILQNEKGENVETKCSMYVDDGIVYLCNVSMIPDLLEVINDYEEASGAKLNMDKTVGIVMKDSLVRPGNVESLEIKLTKGPEKCLGIMIGKNVDISKFWEALIQKMQRKLQVWKTRNLSFQGKVYLIKSIGISTILYACEMICVPDKYIVEIENIIYKFLWDDKKARVRREICKLPVHMGGINMVDIRQIIKAKRVKWILRILQANPDDKWCIIPKKIVTKLDQKFGTNLFMLQINYIEDIIKELNITLFYKECIVYLHEMYRNSKIIDQYETLWYNKKIMFNGKTLSFNHWSKDGIVYISDIIKNGNIDEEHIKSKLTKKANYIFEISKIKASLPENVRKVAYQSRNLILSTTDVLLQQKMKIPGKNEATEMQNLTSKDIYNIMLLNKTVVIKSKTYWLEKFYPKDINFNSWFACNMLNNIIPRKCIDFNWKLFHGQINTEQRLVKMRYSDGFCKLCGNNAEDIEHLLTGCAQTKETWNSIIHMFISLEINVKIDRFSIIAGTHSMNVDDKIANMILSITRFTIWKRRNYWKYEKILINQIDLEKWILREIKTHITVLVKTSILNRKCELKNRLNEIERKLKRSYE